jgi:aspartate 1-decarboxylase
VILATFVELDDAEARRHKPHVVRVDTRNRIVGQEDEAPGPLARWTASRM